MSNIEAEVSRILEANHNRCPLCHQELRCNINKDASDGFVTKAEIFCSDMMNCGHILLQYKNNRTVESYNAEGDYFEVNGKQVSKKDYVFWTGKVIDAIYNENNGKKTCRELKQMIQDQGLPDWWYDAAEELLGIQFMPF